LIAFTGYVKQEDRHLAQAAGFDAFVAKPPDEGEVENMLATISVLLAYERQGRRRQGSRSGKSMLCQ
jgi:CheY-like chemotaxis protein